MPRTLTDPESVQPGLRLPPSRFDVPTPDSHWVEDSADTIPTKTVDSLQVGGGQQLLFGPAPQTFCTEIGLSWARALDLYRDGFLSFSPALVPRLDEPQETELRFLGALARVGCDRQMLSRLLRGLSYPYSYDLAKIYYDLKNDQWRVLPETNPNPETTLIDWLDILVRNNDAVTLAGIIELAREALHRIGHEAK